MKKNLISLFIDKYGLRGIIFALFISFNIGIGTVLAFLLVKHLVGT